MSATEPLPQRTRLNGPWADVTIDGLTETVARARPDRILFADAPQVDSWSDRPALSLTASVLQQQVRRFARMLLTLGLRRGDVVLLMMPHHSDAIIALVGAMAAGLRPCPIPVVAGVDEARMAVDAVGARAIVTVTRYGHLSPADTARDVAASCFNVRFVCAFGARPPEGVVTLHGWREDELRADLPLASHPGDVALITIERAENGLRAFARSHAQLIADGLALSALAGLSVRPHLITTLAPVSVAGVVASVVAPFVSGVGTQITGPFTAETLCDLLSERPESIVTLPAAAETEIAAALDGRLQDRIVVHRQPVVAASVAPHRAVDMLSLGETALWSRLRNSADARAIPALYRHPVGTAMPRTEAYVSAAISPRGRLLLSGFGVAVPLALLRGTAVHGGSVDTGLIAHAAGPDHLILVDPNDPTDADDDLFDTVTRAA